MGRWIPHAAREARALTGATVAPLVAAGTSYLLTDTVLGNLERAILSAIVGVAAALIREINGRPLRVRSAATVGAAAVEVLDRHLLLGEVSFFLADGGPVSLRAYADASRHGRLSDELKAGAQVRFVADELRGLRRGFENGSARSLADLAGWRAIAGELADALGEAAAIADELGDVGDSLIMSRGDEATSLSLRAQAHELYSSLGAALIRAVDAGEKLERRADADAADTRAVDRGARAAKRAIERREARADLTRVSSELLEEVEPLRLPAAQALPAYGWAERRGQARIFYEKFIAVLNRQSIHMDEGTLEHARALQRSLNSLVSATVALEQVELAGATAAERAGFDVLLENGTTAYRDGLEEFARDVHALTASARAAVTRP